MAGTLMYHII